MSDDTLEALLARAVRRYPHRDAFRIDDARITFAALDADADAFAAGLLALGVARGDRVAVWMPNGLPWLVAFHACARIGAVVVPVSTRFKDEEVAHVLALTGASVVLAEDVQGGPDLVGMLARILRTAADTVVDRALAVRTVIGVPGRGGPRPEHIPYDAVLAAGRSASPEVLARARAAVRADDPFLIQSTSGTTGFPKGAVLSQRNFVLTGSEVGRRQALSPDERFFSPAPFFHVSGTMHAMTAPLAYGCTVWSVGRYDLERVVDTIERARCTVYHGFNFFKDWFARDAAYRAERDLGSLDRAWTTGTAVDYANIASLGITACSLYGLSETTGCATICDPEEPESVRTGTVGLPLSGIEVCVKDRTGSGAPVPSGTEGEIAIRGWNLMSGYWGAPQASREAFDADGWLRTGDLGVLDAQGRLRFSGRLKDIIRVGGENLSPLEVENVLRRHEAVAEACIVGVPDARLGEVVCAVVRIKDGGDCDERELMAFCRERIAGYKVPRHVRFVSAFPMTGNAKIRRFEVRAAVLQALAADVSEGG